MRELWFAMSTRRWLLGGGLVIALSLLLLLPATALAAAPSPQDEQPGVCAQCHVEETEAWQDSPHARAITALDESLVEECHEGGTGTECECLSCHTTDFDPASGSFAHTGVTCEACHGEFVEGHPGSGTMTLGVDSSICQNCHQNTFEEWQETRHAAADVQCISCHKSHSQEVRLTDEALCASCHRDRVDDFAHTAHEEAGLTCTDCHLSNPTMDEAEPAMGGGAPSHRFEVASQVCTDCHGETIHVTELGGTGAQDQAVSFSEMENRSRELATELEEARESNSSLRIMSLVTLGVGLGVGGILGLVLAFVLSRIIQGRSEA